MENSKSLVRISSKKLEEECLKTLETIKKRKESEFQNLIDCERKFYVKCQEKRKNSLWSKILGYKEPIFPSDQDLIRMHEKRYDDTFEIPESDLIRYRYSDNICIAKQLLEAAKYADEVFVSTADLDSLI